MDLFGILNDRKSRQWVIGLGGLFIVSFHVVFRPFQMIYYNYEDYITVNIGYGVITFLVLSVYLMFVPIVFKETYLNWISYRRSRMLYLSGIFLSLGMMYFTFKVSFGFYEITLERISTGILALIALGSIPLTIFTIFDTSNELANDPILDFGKAKLRIKLSELLYIVSDGNYVNIVCMKNDQVEIYRVRATIKSLTIGLSRYKTLAQCHRAFLVNTNKISHVSKPKGKSEIYLRGYEKSIPLSKTYFQSFTKY